MVLLAAVLAPAAIANDDASAASQKTSENQAADEGQAGQERAGEKSADHSAAADETPPADEPQDSEGDSAPEGEDDGETGPSPTAQAQANENADQGLEQAGSNENAANGNNGAANSDQNAAGGQGNRGHIQLSSDGETFPPDNEPHLPCVFYVNFYDFREGTEEAEVMFAAQPPSGGPDVPLGAYGPRTVELNGVDEPGVTLNASQQYDLTDAVSDLDRHHQQGYHIKLTVETTPEDVSADQKHHVFWIDCGDFEPQPANLLVDKIVTGDDAPDADTQFTFIVTCNDIDADVTLTDADPAWSWNDDSGEDDLTENSTCSIDETTTDDAIVTVTFNGDDSDENTDEALDAGDGNIFVVTNDYPVEDSVGGVDISNPEAPVSNPDAPVVPGVPVETPDVNEGGVAGEGIERPAPSPRPDVAPLRPVTVPVEVLPAVHEAPEVQAAQDELPRTGVSTATLLILALCLIGFGAASLKQGRAKAHSA